jgi:hypothetical protein
MSGNPPGQQSLGLRGQDCDQGLRAGEAKDTPLFKKVPKPQSTQGHRLLQDESVYVLV